VKEYPEMVGTSLTPGYYGAAAPGFVRKVTPEYPQTAKDKNVQGTVVVLITIGPNAVLQDSSILASSGSDALDKAALAAARQSTYKAPEADNKSSTHRYVVTYTFSLYSIDYQK
jgi:protein TonB